MVLSRAENSRWLKPQSSSRCDRVGRETSPEREIALVKPRSTPSLSLSSTLSQIEIGINLVASVDLSRPLFTDSYGHVTGRFIENTGFFGLTGVRAREMKRGRGYYKAFAGRSATPRVHGWHNNFITLIAPIYSAYNVCRCLRARGIAALNRHRPGCSFRGR